MNKSIRRISMILVVILFGTLLLAGCSSEKTPAEDTTDENVEGDSSNVTDDEEAKDSGEQVELDIFQFKVEIAKQLEGYEAMKKKIKCEGQLRNGWRWR